jgi:hypothetical protein
LEVPNLESHDASTSAWPVLIDEYVEYVEAKVTSSKKLDKVYSEQVMGGKDKARSKV